MDIGARPFEARTEVKTEENYCARHRPLTSSGDDRCAALVETSPVPRCPRSRRGTCSAYSEHEEEMQSACGLTMPFLAAHARTWWMSPCTFAKNVQRERAPVRGIGQNHGHRRDIDTFAHERAGGVARCALGETESESDPGGGDIRKLMISHILRKSTGFEATLFAKRNAFCAH